MPRGYDRALYILPFDHRGSFQTKMFGWKSPLSEAQTRLAEQKGDARANGRRDRQAAITTLSICLSGASHLSSGLSEHTRSGHYPSKEA